MKRADIQNLSDDELHKECLESAKREKTATLELIEHLEEIVQRWLHIHLGYGSIWEYTHKYLGYSESQASERVNTLRLIRRVPKAREMLKDGSLTLTTAAKVSSFLKNSDDQVKSLRKQTNDPTIPKVSAEFVLSKVQGRSKRDVEKILFSISPSAALPREQEKVVNEHFTQITLVADQEFMDLLKEAKAILKTDNNQSTIKNALKEIVSKHNRKMKPDTVKVEVDNDSSNKKEATRPAEEPHLKSFSRYIEVHKRRFLWRRAQGKCEYISPATKKRCESRHRLQIDHILPFSLGGTHDIENLRILCAAHNLERAHAFGLLKENQELGPENSSS